MRNYLTIIHLSLTLTVLGTGRAMPQQYSVLANGTTGQRMLGQIAQSRTTWSVPNPNPMPYNLYLRPPQREPRRTRHRPGNLPTRARWAPDPRICSRLPHSRQTIFLAQRPKRDRTDRLVRRQALRRSSRRSGEARVPGES